MERSSVLRLVLVTVLLVGMACSDDEPAGPVNSALPKPPQSPLGVMAHFGSSPLQVVILWVDSTRSKVDGYNVYKSIGTNKPVRQNGTPVVEQVYGPAGSATALFFGDALLDTTSTSIHRYWITAVNDGQESTASDSVVFVPAQFDTANHVLGMSPDGTQGLSRTPTFSWNPIAGATSYAIGVQEGPGSSPSVWTYWTTSTQCLYRETKGVTYADLKRTSLAANIEIHYGLAAINSDNFAFATSFQDASGSFTTGP